MRGLTSTCTSVTTLPCKHHLLDNLTPPLAKEPSVFLSARLGKETYIQKQTKSLHKNQQQEADPQTLMVENQATRKSKSRNQVTSNQNRGAPVRENRGRRNYKHHLSCFLGEIVRAASLLPQDCAQKCYRLDGLTKSLAHEKTSLN
jgi:hypothetical protein